MEHQKIFNLLNGVNDSKFVTGKWNVVNGHSKANCYVANEITYNTEVLKSNLCYYNDAYILGRGDITVTAATKIQVSFKNCEPFYKCITKIDLTTIDDAETIDHANIQSNRIYFKLFLKTRGSLWIYSKDEAANFNAVIANDNYHESLKYKAKLLGNINAQPANAANGKYSNC